MILDQNLLMEIVQIILVQKKVAKIVLFGSWATGTARKTSDIDLAVWGEDLSSTDVSLIRDRLEEKVRTLLKFDVVHFDTLTKTDLKKDILTKGVVLYESQKN